ncbi:hypothetical protein L1049_011556 [Liquidambar formosana]|uniref:LOB domain-containing protein n=1 Tax=Liquidambar formosana TaxID=63359 RepID=A0AAP0RRJ1_LIQFO
MTELGSSCGACKFLRRKCTRECVFAPYFCYEEAATHFAAVHKVFGASNVSKLLLRLPVHNRSEAAITISYEAQARMSDPIYGCVAHIFALQQQVANLREEIEILGNQMANLAGGFPSCGGFQATNTQIMNSALQFSTQHDAMNIQDYPYQGAPILSVTGNTSANQVFDSQMNVQLPPSYGWEDQNLFCDTEPDLLERLLEGMDQDLVGCYELLNNDSNTER